MKLEETMVIKVLYELRGVMQLLVITRNYKPRALGRGRGVGVRPSSPCPSLKMSYSWGHRRSSSHWGSLAQPAH